MSGNGDNFRTGTVQDSTVPKQMVRPAGMRAPRKQKLDSWKEIACYLGREVRTVQRWEKSAGLPVRRLHHEERGSVYAFVTELDTWVTARGSNTHATNEIAAAPAPRAARVGWVAASILGMTLAIAAAVRILEHWFASPRTMQATLLAKESAGSAYLRGIYFLSLLTDEGISKSIPEFQEAIAREARFAPAYARLAEAHTYLSFGDQREQELAAAREFAHKARLLDDSSAEAHEALALIAAYGGWNWSAAEAEFGVALRLNPELATVHSNYAQLAAILGHNELAVAEGRRAWELQPLSPTLGANLAWYFYWGHRFDDAITTSRQVLQSQPGFHSAQACIVRSLIAQGKFGDARTELIGQLRPGDSRAAGLDAEPAKKAIHNFYLWKLARLKSLERAGEFPSFELALAYAALGEKDALLDCLEKAYEKRQFIAMLINEEPFFEPYRGDPRLVDISRKIGLPMTEAKATTVALMPLR